MMQDRFEELLLAQLAKLEEKISALDKKVDGRLNSLEKETAWIRGKLEARGKFTTDLQSWIALVVAIGALIFVWLK